MFKNNIQYLDYTIVFLSVYTLSLNMFIIASVPCNGAICGVPDVLRFSNCVNNLYFHNICVRACVKPILCGLEKPRIRTLSLSFTPIVDDNRQKRNKICFETI